MQHICTDWNTHKKLLKYCLLHSIGSLLFWFQLHRTKTTTCYYRKAFSHAMLCPCTHKVSMKNVFIKTISTTWSSLRKITIKIQINLIIQLNNWSYILMDFSKWIPLYNEMFNNKAKLLNTKETKKKKINTIRILDKEDEQKAKKKSTEKRIRIRALCK